MLVYLILKMTGSYQLFLALHLVQSLSLQLFLGLQSSQTISFQALCFLLGSSPFLLQLNGSLDLIRELWKKTDQCSYSTSLVKAGRQSLR